MLPILASVVLLLGIVFAASVWLLGGDDDRSADERFTIPGTDVKVTYQVSKEGEALFWLDDQPDLGPLTSSVINEEHGSLEWNGVRLDGYGALDAEQGAALAELFDSPYGQAVPLIALQRACQADSGLNAKQLAALFYAWQMHLKYSPVDRVEEARRMWEASGCADTPIQPPAEIGEDTPILIYSSDAPIPVVFGYFPFDAEGAFELEEPTEVVSIGNFEGLFVSRLPHLLAKALRSSIPLNQYGPCRSKCRGACGGLFDSCPLTNCTKTRAMVCQVDEDGKNTGWQLEVNRYECGVHPGCVEHDACYDACNAKYGCNTWGAAWCRHSGWEGWLGGISERLKATGCDILARQNYGALQCSAWAVGYGGKLGFSETRVWDYTDEVGLVVIPNRQSCPVEEEAGLNGSGADDGYWQLVRTIADPGSERYTTTWQGNTCTTVGASWSDGSISVTINWLASRRADVDCENSRNMAFSASAAWTPPPQRLEPGDEMPVIATVTKGASDVSRWSGTFTFVASEIRPPGNPFNICRLWVSTSGNDRFECEEPAFTVPEGNPGRTLELRYGGYHSSTHGGITPAEVSGTGYYTYVYEWVP